ncbi:uncharacterized protein TM35_000321250 [Trypanosoma theileri]|uniref:Transmembrane protein n=1 Tax=Trypanosoma theileri TaxID=67003 RepID=A0A1X0NNU5_9TRYP|nr:uncharacterized protein TM35_000321250 [Trypanosoma theileri]ORC85810.1 hypothetical protein TM35_000321250 [Trypanosoma theileri]
MSVYSNASGPNNDGRSYHSIKGFAGAELIANPLGSDKKSNEASNDPFVKQQQQIQSLLRNPTTRIEDDGSVVYDPNYLPKSKKIISMAPYDEKEEYDPVEPLFWVVCACTLGLAAFCVFVAVTVLQLPFTYAHGTIVYVSAGSCGGFLFAMMFLFYIAVSKDERYFGRFMDGLIGAIPFILLGALIGYMYSCFLLMMIYLVDDPVASSLNITWWFCIFSTVPPFLVFFIPMFIVAMRVQEASAMTARLLMGLTLPPPGFIPRTNGMATYLFSAFRRFIIGFAMAVGLSGYYAITCFALGWLAYGLYRSTAVYFWIPIVVLAPVLLLLFILLLTIGCLSPFTLHAIFAVWTGPITAWAHIPLRSAYFPHYHAGRTIKQMIRETNHITRRAGRCHVRGEHVRAAELYDEADTRRAAIEERGIDLKERESRGWRKLSARRIQRTYDVKKK